MSTAIEEVVVMDDAIEDAEPLMHELERRAVASHLCSNIDDLLEVARRSDDVVFVLDIDMGPGRHEEGLAAIQALQAMRKKEGKRFLIAALTSHSEFKARAARAGVDIFIVKDKPQIDALEVITYAIQDRIDQHARTADETQSELAAMQYDNLDRQLRDHNIAAALRSVHNALKWPRLLPNEGAFLRFLATQLSTADRELTDEAHDERYKLLRETVDLLRKDRGRSAVISEWLGRLKEHNIDVIHRWLDDEQIEKLMEDF